jgi:cell division protein FtsW
MILIVGLGVAALFSASWHFSDTVFGDAYRLWRRQLVWTVLGIAAAVAVARLPLAAIKAAVPALVWITVGFNLLTYIPGIGYASGGARRWIEVAGFSFQPSELVRITLVLYLARMLEKNANRLDDVRNALLPPFLVVLILVMTVYFQNDFSTAAYLFALALGMFYAAGASWPILTIAGITSLVTAAGMLAARPYRLQRIQSWFRPAEDPTGTGFQILRSRIALERGGFWGGGLGRGITKRGGLPAAHSDFVAAVIGEEAGFIGILVIIALFTLLALKGWSAAMKNADLFSRLAIFGLVASIYWQVLINLGVVSGAVPATGIPLPLFSAGGSAAFTTLVTFGLLVNLSKSRESRRAG